MVISGIDFFSVFWYTVSYKCISAFLRFAVKKQRISNVLRGLRKGRGEWRFRQRDAKG